MSTEIEYLDAIYNLLLEISSFFEFLTGIFQFGMVVFAIVILYKLINLFF